MSGARASVYPCLLTLGIFGGTSVRCTKMHEPAPDAVPVASEGSNTPGTAGGSASPPAREPLRPASTTPPPTHAWPLLPVVFAPRPPLADDLTVAFRARRGAVVHAVHTGRVVRVANANEANADAGRGPTSKTAGELTVEIASEDGLRIFYLGMHEALVRPGVRVASGAPVGVMTSSTSGTLQIWASQGEARVAPLSLLGH